MGAEEGRLSWKPEALDDLRVRVRARTKRSGVLEREAAAPRPRRRSPLALCDFHTPEPHATWDPSKLESLASHVHELVPRSPPEPLPDSGSIPFTRLDHGATESLWQNEVHIGAASICVPLRRQNTELAQLAGVTALVAGASCMLLGFALVAASLPELSAAVGSTPLASTSSALLVSLPPGALGPMLAGGALLVAAQFLAGFGMWASWRASRRHALMITMHGIRLDDRRISYDEILDVHASDTTLTFELLDGTDLQTPAEMLEPHVARSIRAEVKRRLPDEQERAAGFVAYERARQALNL